MLEFLLLLTAFILVNLFSILGFITAIIKSIYFRKYSYLKKYFKKLALSLDQLGNVVMYPLFNWIFIKDASIFPFGNEDETISSVLGRNKQIDNFRYLGRKLDQLLNYLDPNHSIKSIGS